MRVYVSSYEGAHFNGFKVVAMLKSYGNMGLYLLEGNRQIMAYPTEILHLEEEID